MACHYVMLIAKPDSQNRLLLTGSKNVAHYERSWCRQKRSCTCDDHSNNRADGGETPIYKSSAGKPHLPNSTV